MQQGGYNEEEVAEVSDGIYIIRWLVCFSFSPVRYVLKHCLTKNWNRLHERTGSKVLYFSFKNAMCILPSPYI